MAAAPQYFESSQIDPKKWDEAIAQASNGSVYAQYQFLTHLTDQWGALIDRDYQFVMPLPWRKKYGIRYLYQPHLIAQLGLIGPHPDQNKLEKFLNAIPPGFRLWDLTLNRENLYELPEFPLRTRMNYVLDLNHPYEYLRNCYRENHNRNIKRAERYGCLYSPEIDLNHLFTLAKDQYQGIQSPNFERLKTLIQSGSTSYYCAGVKDKNQQLLASALLLKYQHRLYYLVVGNHPNGRTLGASHLLIDGLIKSFAGQDLVLDFEGSDVSSLAFFYSGFGSKEEPYAALRMNRLPALLKWLIRS